MLGEDEGLLDLGKRPAREMTCHREDLGKRPAREMTTAEYGIAYRTAGGLQLMDLPDELLSKILVFVTVRGKVCNRWEHVKILLARERCVKVLMHNASLDEVLAREVEQELFCVSSCKVGADYKSALRRIIFNVRPGSKNASIRQCLLSRTLTAQAVVRLTPEELASQEERDHKAATRRETVKKLTAVPSDLGRVESRLYKCPRCGGERSWVRKWRRGSSANQVDRIKLFMTCIECNHTWEE